MSEDYYALTPKEVLEIFETSEKGLTGMVVKKRLRESGLNELQKGKKTSSWVIFLNQFKNALILLLVFACMLSLALGDKIEAIAIAAIILLNAILGFIQEFRAEKAIEALEKISAPTAKVMRDGREQKILAKELVPGDTILLEAGDIVPADSRIIEHSSLQIDEASLTGESVPSKKFTKPLKKETSIADQENMAFMNTIVTYGKARCIVTSTGMGTEMGKIAATLQTTKETKTPLQKKFEQLARQIGIVTIILIVVVLGLGIIQKTLSFGEMLLVALALTVSTIPNSLPLVVTVGLSMGTKRLAKKNMLIKKLPAAESLGAATIICSDKTGTITKNQMTITKVYANKEIIEVSGSGYQTEGTFSSNNRQVDPQKMELLLRTGYLCNNSKLEKKGKTYDVIGDPTEGSLIVLAKKGDLKEDRMKSSFKFIEELPFDSERKRMSVIFRNKKDKKTEAYVKGAPDLLLKECNRIIINGKISKLTKKQREDILKTNNQFAEKALRVLALAYREVPDKGNYSISNVEKGLVFIGLVGMIDPPRNEVKQAIDECQEAGIKVMLITGDHAVTTRAIAEHIGLFKKGDIILEGKELEKLTDKQLENKIDKIKIIARALPVQKSRIVDALKRKGHIVAMTGDGVNDAPALKKADIGIAMGITGTDVAKEVSKATLVDDNFATIVNAIEEGRNIYHTLIRSAKFFLACNTGEITSVFIAILLRFPLPLLPLQILLMNMLTDNFPALGLGFESGEEGVMKCPPRDPKEKPITRKMFLSIVIFGLIMGLGTLAIFMKYKEIDLVKAQTVAFTTLVMFQMFAVISSRSLYPSLSKLNPFSNMWLLGAVSLSLLIQVAVIYIPPLQTIFGTTSLSAENWIQIIAISSLGFIGMELSKSLLNIRSINTQTK